ncbi:MAG: hypothetical protein LBQ28_03930 [Prevotellaceae bacterium]|jgi:predicted  nucleic acid-binding Zn-ribbon protein|nr:hypothetical protein [Prevotellaceae bacterium]
MKKEGLFMKENRFFVEGEGNVKYSHNNGRIANDPKLAVQSFLHALEKIPTLIENHEKKNVELSRDLPVLQEIAKSVWRKEDELKALKTEFAALDRKIHLSLKPIDQSEDKPNEKQGNEQDTNAETLSIPKKLQEYKQAMGERLIIASVPKYDSENKSKMFKI